MAETTTDETEMTRAETAEFLRSIADDLDSAGGPIGIPVGNKTVQLSPPETIDVETSVTERSRRLRADTEELSVTFAWNASGDTDESERERDDEQGSESPIDPEPGR